LSYRFNVSNESTRRRIRVVLLSKEIILVIDCKNSFQSKSGRISSVNIIYMAKNVSGITDFRLTLFDSTNQIVLDVLS